MKTLLLPASLIIVSFSLFSRVFAQNQKTDSPNPFLGKDTLPKVIVIGYGTQKKLIETPASIAIIGKENMHVYSGESLTPLINTNPGVDFQERSPGNYRFSIRGSTLRSSFNVRNIKVYLNEIPYSDAGGTSWITPIDVHSIGSIEILKGPAGSSYGAGSGGTVFIQSKLPLDSGKHMDLDFIAGSFGTHGLNIGFMTKESQNSTYLNFSKFEATGYRSHSGIDRQMLHFSGKFKLQKKDMMTLSIFYSDLHYQTPYSLTAAQYNADPKQARPATPQLPSPITNNTGEYVKKFFLGISNQYVLNSHFENISSLGVSPDLIQNNSVNTIQKTSEQNYSLRTQTTYRFLLGKWKSKVKMGAEYLYSFQTDRDFGNLKGTPDSVSRDDEFMNTQWFGFGQMEIDLPNRFFLNMGASYNQVKYTIQRLYLKPSVVLNTHFDPIFSPRIALLKKFNENQSIYSSYSFGYSPPASGEMLPSTGIFNKTLQAEISKNLEFGYRGNFLSNFLNLDLTLFLNQIKNSIIRRSDSLGQDFYLNAGSSEQKGMEGLFRINAIQNNNSILQYFSIWSNFTLNQFRFKNYILNGQNLSGNPFTGVAPYVLVSGMDFQFLKGFYAYLNYHYSDRIPLNDQNTVKSKPYNIFGGKIGMSRPLRKNQAFDLSFGVDNFLNKRYSLGNDINSAGGRYFNPAPIRNFFIGLSLHY